MSDMSAEAKFRDELHIGQLFSSAELLHPQRLVEAVGLQARRVDPGIVGC